MKIGIDARFWNETGVGRYIRNLVINLQIIDKKNEYILFVTPKDEKAVESVLKSSRFQVKVINIPWHSLSEQIQLPSKISKEKVDLMHFPYFAVPLLYKKPFVVTIHDLILHHFATGEASTLPEIMYRMKLLAYKFIIKNAAKRAERVIVVSQATKDEVIDHLKIEKDKIEVIYEGYELSKTTLIPGALKKPYFLHVGNVYPHKNSKVLIDAFEKFSIDTHLYFVGKSDFFTDKLKKYIEQKNIKNISFLHTVNDSELSTIYSEATAVVVPSLMEGFGLPTIESMSHQTPVIASDIPSLREITGGNALFFDPTSQQALEQKMQLVLNSKNELKDLTTKARKYIEKYDWKKMAEQTLKIYESSTRIR